MMLNLGLITFIDIEASGLSRPDSYPIEIGWADTMGNSDTLLVRPIHHWTHWDAAAETLHGITRKQLQEDGIPVGEAACRLNDMLGVETIFCDALEFDGFWLSRLFEAAGMEPAFQLADVYQLYATLGTERSAQMRAVLDNTPVPHRAREDAARYAAAYRAVMETDEQQAQALLDQIEPWAGSRDAAWDWYRTYPIAALGGLTAECLVARGRTADVLQYLTHIRAGGFS